MAAPTASRFRRIAFTGTSSERKPTKRATRVPATTRPTTRRKPAGHGVLVVGAEGGQAPHPETDSGQPGQGRRRPGAQVADQGHVLLAARAPRAGSPPAASPSPSSLRKARFAKEGSKATAASSRAVSAAMPAAPSPAGSAATARPPPEGLAPGARPGGAWPPSPRGPGPGRVSGRSTSTRSGMEHADPAHRARGRARPGPTPSPGEASARAGCWARAAGPRRRGAAAAARSTARHRTGPLHHRAGARRRYKAPPAPGLEEPPGLHPAARARRAARAAGSGKATRRRTPPRGPRAPRSASRSRGTRKRARKPMATGTPERATVAPACRPAVAAAVRESSPAARASRNRLTVSRA